MVTRPPVSSPNVKLLKKFIKEEVIDGKRFSAKQIIVKLLEAEIIESKGLPQVESAKNLRICESTLGNF